LKGCNEAATVTRAGKNQNWLGVDAKKKSSEKVLPVM
jgi:hypothetical protein